MKKTLVTAKRFVDNHRTGLAVAGTFALCTYLHIKVIDNVNERLEELGIDPMEFHTSEEY